MTKQPDEAPLCECGCGLPVKSRKNGVWSRWRPGHSSRKGNWRERTPEKVSAQASRWLDEQLRLFEEP